MKKYLMLLFLPLLIGVSACDKEDNEPEMPNDGATPGSINSYASKVINCDCGKTYVVYFKKPNGIEGGVASDWVHESYFPDGESNDWIVKIINGGNTVNYPMTISYYDVIEYFCEWSCECGKKFSERRDNYKRFR